MSECKEVEDPRKERNLAKEEKLRREHERRAAREEAKRKTEQIKEGKRKVVAIVEEIVDEKLDEETLIERCKFLCKQDYSDVNVERSLINVCGYPLCYANLPKPCKQRYRISLAEHKVYDISERKLFCSNLCYKASSYLREQLEDEPFWMRNSTSIPPAKVQIYRDTKGARGEEVLIVPRVEAERSEDSNPYRENDIDNLIEVEEKDSPEKISRKKQTARLKNTFIASPYIKEKDLTEFGVSMSKLTIKEKELQ